MQWDRSLTYLDDICLSGKMMAQVAARLETVLLHLMDSCLRLKVSKCTFFVPEVRYLGHVVNSNGISCDSDTNESMRK